MKNEREFAMELSSELLSLRREVEEFARVHDGQDCGLSDFLEQIAKYLEGEELDAEFLKNLAFGIFRLVTDSFELEESSVGKKAMKLRLKLRELASMLE